MVLGIVLGIVLVARKRPVILAGIAPVCRTSA